MAIADAHIITVLTSTAHQIRACGSAREALYDRRGREAPLLTPGPGGARNYWHEHGVAADEAASDMGRIANALTSADDGRLVSLDDIKEWFESLGTDYVLPLPRARRWGDRIRPAGNPSLTDEAAQSLGQIEMWYSQPGTGAVAIAVRRVRAILAAIDRVVAHPDNWLKGPIQGTREAHCQQHRIIYKMVDCDDAALSAPNVVVLEILSPPQA